MSSHIQFPRFEIGIDPPEYLVCHRVSLSLWSDTRGSPPFAVTTMVSRTDRAQADCRTRCTITEHLPEGLTPRSRREHRRTLRDRPRRRDGMLARVSFGCSVTPGAVAAARQRGSPQMGILRRARAALEEGNRGLQAGSASFSSCMAKRGVPESAVARIVSTAACRASVQLAGSITSPSPRSAQRRSLIERVETPEAAAFTRQSVVLECVTWRLVETVAKEIERGQAVLLVEQPLIRVQAKDCLRRSQYRLIVHGPCSSLAHTSSATDHSRAC